MLLTDRVVVITGGRRVGPAMAGAVARRGADVVVSYNRSKSEAAEAAARVTDAGRRSVVVQADVSDPRACEALMAEADRQLGRIDVLVAMASVYEPVPIEALTPEVWRQQVGVDLDGTFLCAMAAIPYLRRAGGGRIVTISDWLAASGRPRYKSYVPYYVAKAGVKALTEALALELARDGILVNSVAPGPIHPPPGTTDEERRAVERETPLGRWGGSDAIVQAVLGLLDSDFITGETVRADGGRHLK
jgi:NAD(P)-dependent dehydrogenase (short-subunit alcohol dehydrogenase family)